MEKNVEITGSNLPDRLRELRIKKNLTKIELADKAGLNYRTIHEIEKGARDRVQEMTLVSIAEALDTTYEELLKGHPAKTSGRGRDFRAIALAGALVVVAVIVTAVVYKLIYRESSSVTAMPTHVVMDITERFDGADPGVIWKDVSRCGFVSTAGGRLLLSKSEDCTGGAILMMKSEYAVVGDFDIRVDYRLELYPRSFKTGIRYTSLKLLEAETGGLVAGIDRYTRYGNLIECVESHEEYKMYSNSTDPCTAARYPTSDREGKLRMVRLGDRLMEFYWNDSGWVEGLNRQTIRGPVHVLLSTGCGEKVTGAQRASFDNLTILLADASFTRNGEH